MFTSLKSVSVPSLIIAALTSAVVSGVGWYTNWINSTFNAQTIKIEQLTTSKIDVDHNLDIVNSKIDLLLDINGLKYVGPKFKPSSQEGETK